MSEAFGLEDATKDRRFGRAALAAVGLVALMCLPVSAAQLGAEGAQQIANCPKTHSMLVRDGKLNKFAKKLAEKTGLRVLAIGSSSTQGVGATSAAKTYPARFEEEMRNRFRALISVANAGIGGETADATVSRLENSVSTGRYDLVIWQVGTNDAVRGGDEAAFRSMLERGLRAAKAANTEVILLDQQFFPTVKDPVRYERFVNIIETVGVETNTPVLSRYRMMKAWGERAPQDLPQMLSADGFHMSDRGYGCLANAMASAMTDLIAPPPAPANGAAVTASVPRALLKP